ncbi:hypothetical protein [Ktedonobacter racemifer]|uniref:Uncharacterized protein n=1 Tax=Ktedonobacter racemifer DSM 44963 TaxID=485913 RepID=D6TG86_KTERA|nr:hypothetical protein [Ktedonobacter racemifer]EFH88788.1 hypothetical protein Krac_10286 [Ktedonobacter racemifer DSM 44963]
MSSTTPDTTPRKLLLSGLTVILAAGIYWGARRWLLRPAKQPTSDPQQKTNHKHGDITNAKKERSSYRS